jgi:hypothetical protein
MLNTFVLPNEFLFWNHTNPSKYRTDKGILRMRTLWKYKHPMDVYRRGKSRYNNKAQSSYGNNEE